MPVQAMLISYLVRRCTRILDPLSACIAKGSLKASLSKDCNAKVGSTVLSDINEKLLSL